MEAQSAVVWLPLWQLLPGTLFETQEGERAIKSEYTYRGTDIAQCVLLGSGEYAHFPDGNNTLVRVLPIGF